VAQTVTNGGQKVCPESESLKFSRTPTPQVENPSDSDSDSSTPTPQPWVVRSAALSRLLPLQLGFEHFQYTNLS